MSSESGLVKILNFGLAKLTERGAVTEGAATRTLKLQTDEGTVMGTAAYMSPEQAEGKPVDARSDIFSFGAVLYEMATGRRAFQGDSQAATMAAVLNKEPSPPRDTAPDVPAELERVVMRCLRKDPNKRQQHMTDVRFCWKNSERSPNPVSWRRSRPRKDCGGGRGWRRPRPWPLWPPAPAYGSPAVPRNSRCAWFRSPPSLEGKAALRRSA